MKLHLLTAALLMGSTSFAQLPNAGFEQLNASNNTSFWGKNLFLLAWVDSTGEIHSDSVVFDGGNLYFPTTDAHTGTYALEMRNAWNYTQNIGYPGGAFLNPAEEFYSSYEAPINQTTPIQPERFTFWYKYFPVGTDIAYANVMLYNENYEPVGEATFETGDAMTAYTYVDIPITYTQVDPVHYLSVSFLANSPANPNQPNFGTRFLVDDVAFEGTLGINEQQTAAVTVYPNPATTFVTIVSAEPMLSAHLSDAAGRTVPLTVTNLSAGQAGDHIDCSGIAAGSYLLQIETASGTTAKPLHITP
jgi:hypothetical protein